ncbi:patatin-like protein [Sphingomonas gilva]|uniref:Patatin-like protein n=1 Tax=Sphingomonas gilva TaxID=2305907 RepID=A0A396RKZ8_9SPHN|nr:patatin-like protein [Sphingomonas gilva]RHW16978.1 patatin-like protein [Sphingomonas gilva]
MREKELRLALVCYGGISLAVYMHGITKEVWRLARASRAYHDGLDPATGSQGVYRALIEEIETAGEMRLRVLPDIIAGASAGGINGVFLAQAIASGLSLEPLTDLWLDMADVEALIAPEAAPGSRFTKMWAMPIAWLAAGNSEKALEDIDPETREEVRGKLAHFIRSRWFEPPFGGPQFTGMLLDAFAAMGESERGPRLLPDGQPLDLFVTVTDFRGYPERLRLNSPPEIVETEHRLTFGFTDGGVAIDALAQDAELAYAARATSSFPGAFPPFTVAELDAVLKERGVQWEGRESFLSRILPRHAAINAAEGAVLVDGSVLANAPFRPAIDALRERPARREIDRRFVYIDPRPGHRFGARADTQGVPGFFSTIIGAISEIPREQPIRDNLEAIEARTRRIEQMRGVIEDIRPEVEARVESLFGTTFLLDWPTPARLAAWRAKAQGAAAKQSGFAFAAYANLKLVGVADSLASMMRRIGGDASHARHLALRAAIERTLAGSRAADPDAVPLLRAFDIAFRIRRLRLLARRLTEIEQEATHPALTLLRDAIYDSLTPYLEVKRTTHHAHLAEEIDSVAEDASLAMDALAASLGLATLDAQADERLAAAFAALPKEARRPLLLAYLGFPFYDVATLPLLQGEGLDEFDPVRVDRISPDDCGSIRQGGAEATLKGIQFNSFGAFFSRAYRENDYLWGRLHGAERLIDILVSTLPPGRTLGPGRVAAAKHAAFVAILDEEQDRLRAIPGLIEQLRTEIG